MNGLPTTGTSDGGYDMTESVLASIITGSLSLVGVVITILATSKKQEKATAVAQAVTDTKIEELTREVREHNNFAQRMPVLQRDVKALERRVGVLEKYHRDPTNKRRTYYGNQSDYRKTV